LLYWNYVDRDPKQLVLGKGAADRALRLVPDLPEAHGALGWYAFTGLRDWDQALEQFTQAARARPSDPVFTLILGAINEHKGNWDQALVYGHEAVLLSPLSGATASGLGGSYTRRREFAAANYYYDRALRLTPHSVSARLTRAIGYLNLTGDRKGAQLLFPDVSDNIAPTGLEDNVISLSDIILLLSDAQQTKLVGLTPATLDGDTAGLALAKALVYRSRHELPLARASFDSARAVLEHMVRQRPDDHLYHALLGLAFAGLGRREEAINEGKRAVELIPVSKDAVDGALLLVNFARICALLGDADKAVDLLNTVFSRPGPLSAAWLRVDPLWDGLRGSPAFQRLVATRS